MTEKHLTLKEVASELRISAMQAHHLVTSGALPAIDTGRGSKHYWRVPRVELDKYVEKRLAETARRFQGGVA